MSAATVAPAEVADEPSAAGIRAGRHLALVEWNDVPGPVGAATPLEAGVRAGARAHPERIAVEEAGACLSYGELLRRAEALAAALRAAGVGPERVVLLVVDRGIEVPVAMLAVHLAGGAYVPLEADHPVERARLVLEVARPVAAIASPSPAAHRLLAACELPAELPVLSPWVEPSAAQAPADLVTDAPAAPLDALGYVRFTSGSTGVPKGVAVTRGALAGLLRWLVARLGFNSDDRLLAVTTPAFDVAEAEVWPPLLAGGRLSFATLAETRDGRLLAERFAASRTTIFAGTPASFRLLLAGGWTSSPGLRTYPAGEALPGSLAREVLAAIAPEGELWNLYGPTEATVYCTYAAIDAAEAGAANLAIGRPVAGAEAYVLDAALRTVRRGEPAEVWVGGPAVARGYLGRPALTAERFRPNPAATAGPGERLYRTGDLARQRPDGQLEYLGRVDHQVKIHGQRIELGEIEAVLASHPAVAEVRVLPQEHGAAGERLLVAYVVARPASGLAGAALAAHAAPRLPAYMQPRAYRFLAGLPLTATGKVDTRALPLPAREDFLAGSAYRPPATVLEASLCDLLSRLLGGVRVGASDSFFALGGSSVLAGQLLARIERELGASLSYRDLFDHPSAAELAPLVAGAAAPAAPITPQARCGDRIPLSFEQERLYFVEKLAGGAAHHNVPTPLHLAGRLDVAALARALDGVEARHLVLAGRFAEAAGRPVQVLAPARRRPLPVVDLRRLGKAAMGKAEALLLDEATRPFDLAAGPLWRRTLLRSAEAGWQLCVTVHHLAFDGSSVAVLRRELGALYAAHAAGLPACLPPPRLQFADFALWQRAELGEERLARHLTYWRQALAGAPHRLELPVDRPRAAVGPARRPVAASEALLVPALVNAIGELASRQRATPFVVTLVAFQALLARLCGQPDLLVGVAFANRNQPGLDDLMGFFVNTLPLRGRLAACGRALSWQELLEAGRGGWLAALEHQEMPFDRLVSELGVERDLAHMPLLQAALAYQNLDLVPAVLPGLTATAPWLEPVEARFDVVLEVREEAVGRLLRLELAADLFDPSSARRFRDHLLRLLSSLVSEPQRPALDVPLLSASERQQLTEWNDTALAAPPGLLQERFLTWAARQPEATALVVPAGEGGTGEERLSYGEVARRAAALAAAVAAAGLGAEDLVAIEAERGPAFVVAMLGVLLAGAAYLPIDPRYPASRRQMMLADSGARLHLVASAALADAGDGPPRLALDAIPPAVFTPVRGLADRLAYVIYTSGSTGKPKGVMIAHAGVHAFAPQVAEHLGAVPGNRVLQFASPSFDASVLEIWAALAGGASLIFVDEEARLSGRLLTRFLNRQWIDGCFLTPAVAAGVDTSALDGVPFATLGAERCSPELMRRWATGRRLRNVYGPTEATVYCSTARLWPGQAGEPPLGRPLANVDFLVVDRRGREVPRGVSGELGIGGGGLARGYLARPGLTAATFRPHPRAGRTVPAGARLYLSGDRMRLTAAGELEFLGRVDQQVKIRGLRVELGEIEAALRAQDRVAEAKVVVRETAAGPQLVAYWVPRTGVAPAPEAATPALLAALRTTLPEVMVPAALVPLAALPLNANGKVDTAALPAPTATALGGEVDVAPRTPTERRLAAIWERVLERPVTSVEASFFALGGHSLLAGRLLAEVEAELGVKLPMRSLFDHPTVATLAELVAAGRPAASAGPLQRTADGRWWPLSSAQERLWFLDRLEPGGGYNVPSPLLLAGELAPRALALALAAIVGRHAVLRSVFQLHDGRPAQRALAPRPAWLPVIDLSGLAAPAGVRDALLAREARRPFDLAHGPVLRSGLLRTAPREWALWLTVHHIAFDGWSVGVLHRELTAQYEAWRCHGRSAELVPLALQYADYALWEAEWRQGPELAAGLAFWRQAIGEAPQLLDLPLDHARGERGRTAGDRLAGTVCRRLEPPLVAGVEALCRELGCTPFVALLGAFQVLLGRLAGQRELLVGTAAANRNQPGVADLVGFFVNTLVLRGELMRAGRPLRWRELLLDVRQRFVAALEHQEVPFDRLVAELGGDRDPGASPLVQAVLAFQSLDLGPPRLPGLTVSSPWLPPGEAKFDLVLEVRGFDAEPELRLEYTRALFDRTTAERLLDHFVAQVAALAGGPEQSILAAPLLSVVERQQLSEWNDTAATWPAAALHAWFLAQASRQPDAVAAVAPAAGAASGQEERLSYGELARRARAVAAALGRFGVSLDEPVAIEVPRGPDLLVAIVGVLFSGAAYLPLDPKHPLDRRAATLRDAGARLVIRPQAPAATADGETATLTLAEALAALPAAQLPVVPPAALAYVIYTSGSTGRPKGVMVSHGSAHGFAARVARDLGAGPGKRLLQFASPGFDASVLEIWAGLAGGASLCFVDEEARLSPKELAAFVRRHAIDSLFLTPAVAEGIDAADLGGVTRAMVGADRCSRELAERWSRGRVLLNAYGPTEATVYCAIGRLDVPLHGEPPLGRPIERVQLLVMGRTGLTLPAGVPGELWIGGAGLARGYLGRPGLTAAAFRPHPGAGRTAAAGERLYRSGDRVRLRASGELDFLGRIDHQVKVRGYRIELGEVEAALLALPSVERARVVVRQRDGAARLVAYYVPHGEAPASPAELAAGLRRSLPEPMVPAAFVALAALPLNASGKIDTGALPEPDWASLAAARGITPRTPTEAKVAAIWAAVLDRETVGVEDSFFDLGGHSLLAARLLAEIERQLGSELPLRELFAEPTVAGLARRLEAARGEPVRRAAIRRVERGGPLAPSFAQERLWFFDQLAPGNTVYNITAALRLAGSLEVPALRAALSAIVTRHEVLRTTFAAVSGQPRQVIAPPSPVALPVLDLASLPPAGGAAEVSRLSAAEAARPFDLARGPLLRVRLLRLAPAAHVLLLNLHHIAGDGWSVGVFFGELAALYGAFHAGEQPRLAPLGLQYADYAAWHREWLASDEAGEQMRWWLETLAGTPTTIELPLDRPRPAVAGTAGAFYRFALPPALSAQVGELARGHGATLFMVGLAAFGAVLGRMSGQHDLLIGTPFAGRPRSELGGLVGFFVNTLPIRLRLASPAGAPALRFDQLLAAVRALATAAVDHQMVPLEQLIDRLKVERTLAHNPLFQVLFTAQDADDLELALPGLAVTPLDVETAIARLDMSFGLRQERDWISGSVEYRTDLFDAATIERLVADFEAVLAAAVHQPQIALDALPVARRQAVVAPALAGAVELSEDAEQAASQRLGEAENRVADRRAGLSDARKALLAKLTRRDGGTVGRPAGEAAATAGTAAASHQPAAVTGSGPAPGGETQAVGEGASRREALPADRRALLAKLVKRSAGAAATTGAETSRRIPRRPSGPAPLSFAQERMWFLERLEPGSPFYNVPFFQRLRGPLVVAAFSRALDRVVARHEVLRSRLLALEGEPRQLIDPAVAQPLPVVDLGSLPATARESQVEALCAREALRGFDLGRGPVLRRTLLRLAAVDHVLLLSVHHVASDNASVAVLRGEIATSYLALLSGHPPHLPELPVQYADYAAWQRAWLASPSFEAQRQFWLQQLAGLPPLLELPTDHPRPPVQSYRGGSVIAPLPAHLTAPFRALAQRERATGFMLGLAALSLLLYRLTGERDLAVGTPVSGRHAAELEPLIGLFLNTLVMRVGVAPEAGFGALVARVRGVTLDAFAHQELPFERLVDELAPERSLGHSPLFQVMYVHQPAPGAARVDLAGLTVESLPVDLHSSKFDLMVAIVESDTELALDIEHALDLFDPTTVARWRRAYTSLLAAALANPETPVAALPMLSRAERWQLLAEWNDRAAAYPFSNLAALVLAPAAAQPEATALACGDELWSYGGLAGAAGRLARRLAAAGVGPDVPVGLACERTATMVVAVLAVLGAGGAFVPLDPAYPADRLAFMLADSGGPLLATDRELAALPIAGSARQLLLEAELATAMRAEPLPWVEISPENLAYVVYTSGTTGRPKGIALPVRALTNLLAWHLATYGRGRRTLGYASFSFDVFTYELIVALGGGGTLELIPEAARRDERQLAAILADRQVEEAVLPPVMLQQLAEHWAATGVDLVSLQHVTTTGEAMQITPAVARLFAGLPGCELHNFYGPAETHGITAYTLREPPERWPMYPPIGHPIAGAQLYVTDRTGRAAAAATIGEVRIGGEGLARGYLGRPRLTAEKFVPDPFGPPGGRLYRTGDLARWRPRAELEFVGRVDHQVKLRGFRIELGEIESVLGTHPAVREVVALVREVARPAGGSEKRLVAYVVPAAGAPAVAALRDHLLARLPDYMVPSQFVFLEALPLTQNGKVDRRALPDPEGGDADAWAPPSTPLEELLAGIWREVLGVERVGRHDSFFALGGHSLLGTRVLSRVLDTFGVELPLRTLFEAPSLAEAARAVEARLGAGTGAAAPPPAPVARTGREALSFAQERLWFLDQLGPGQAIYSLPVALALAGELSIAALSATVGEIARRHEVLRSRFAAAEGRPYTWAVEPAPVRLPVVDLGGLPAAAQQAATLVLAEREAARPFDLARGPVWRGMVLRRGSTDHVAVFNLHHIVADGWSFGVLTAEIAALYPRFQRWAGARGRDARPVEFPEADAALLAPAPVPAPAMLPDLPIQYADFAAWQRGWLQGEALAAQLAHWRQALAGVPSVLDLPFDRPRGAVQTFRGAHVPVELTPEVAARLAAVAAEHRATPFMVLLAAFATLLGRLSGEDDVVVGSPVANRGRRELEGLIGLFVNNLALRAELGGEPTFAGLLARLRLVVLGAYAHQDLPFERLVEELGVARSLAHHPVFQVVLSYQARAASELSLPGLTLRPVELADTTAKLDLLCGFAETATGLAGALQYNADLFDAATGTRLARGLGRLLAAGLAAPERRLGKLPLLAAAEAAQLLGEWSGRGAQLAPAGRLEELFSRSLARGPEAIALETADEQLSYGALAQRAAVLAGRLVAAGVGPEGRVAVLLPRGIDFAVAVLASFAVGAAYVPLDPAHPRERLAFLLADSAAQGVLTRRELAAVLPPEAAVLWLDEPAPAETAAWSGAPAAPPEALAYVIYTSGSTGRPNGVMVPHAAARRLLESALFAFRMEPASRLLAQVSTSFDASVLELWLALASGARLVVADEATRVDGEALTAYCRTRQVTTGVLTPAVLALLEPAALPALTTLSVGGESCPAGLAARWAVGRRLLNCYGPTEAAIYATVKTVDAAELSGGEQREAPLGRPVTGTCVYVLDRRGAPVPPGVAGQLWLGGGGLARGYVGRPALSAWRFQPDPFGEQPGERLYRTGDRVRWNHHGELEFLGRVDSQVKVRGLRIELGEVEAALQRHPALAEAVVTAPVTAQGSRTLAAYVVPAAGEAGGAGLVARLRADLAATLPEYMVPALWVELAALPRTPTGKLDRRALPPPVAEAAAQVPPRDLWELALARIWGEVLGLAEVSVESDFFALGGHSLLAVRLLARIEAELGVKLPLASLFAASTVAALARLVREGGAGAASLLVPIVPGGTRPPLFLVHPAGGDVLCYGTLAQHLGEQLPGQPVYGLRSAGLEAGEELAPSLTAMAAAYVAEVRRRQPQGPYQLGGWSLGGLVAYEMGRQLLAAGETVAALLVIDTTAGTGEAYRTPDEVDLLLDVAAYVETLWARPLGLSRGDLVPLASAARLDLLLAHLGAVGFLPAGTGPEPIRRLLAVYRANLEAAAAYRPEPPPAGTRLPVSVLAAGERGGAETLAGNALLADPTLGWGALVGEVAVEVLAANHLSLLAEPAVAALAAAIAPRLAGDGGELELGSGLSSRA